MNVKHQFPYPIAMLYARYRAAAFQPSRQHGLLLRCVENIFHLLSWIGVADAVAAGATNGRMKAWASALRKPTMGRALWLCEDAVRVRPKARDPVVPELGTLVADWAHCVSTFCVDRNQLAHRDIVLSDRAASVRLRTLEPALADLLERVEFLRNYILGTVTYAHERPDGWSHVWTSARGQEEHRTTRFVSRSRLPDDQVLLLHPARDIALVLSPLVVVDLESTVQHILFWTGSSAETSAVTYRHPIFDWVRQEGIPGPMDYDDKGPLDDYLAAPARWHRQIAVGLSQSDARALSGSPDLEGAAGYELVGRLGEGAMGTVWEMQHVGFGEPQAVKILKPELLASPIHLRRFKREAKTLRQLEHPNIVKVHDVGSGFDGNWYIAMELLDGLPLSEFVRAGNLMRPEQAIKLVGDLLMALEYIHARQVVHRDIKPSNVMLVDGCAKLIDFGVVKVLGGTRYTKHQTGGAIGTDAFMAPEQLDGEAEAASDIYATGRLMFALLVGRTPHLTEPEDILALLPELPAHIGDVYRMSTARRPRDRFATAADMRCALRLDTLDVAAACWGPRAGSLDAKELDAAEREMREAGRLADFIAALQDEAQEQGGEEPGAATDVLERIAALKEELGDGAGAVLVYHEILANDPRNPQAREYLLRHYNEGENWDALAELYERMLDAATSSAEALEAAMALGRLHQQCRQDPARAADAYHRALSLDKGNFLALTELDTLLQQLGRWREHIKVLNALLECVPAESDWVAIKARIARTYADRLRLKSMAINVREEVLARVPDDDESLAHLDELLAGTEDQDRRLAVLERRATLASDPTQRNAFLCARAGILLRHMSDSDGAVRVLAQVLRSDSTNYGALSIFQEISAGKGDWHAAVAISRLRIDAAQTDSQRAAAHFDAARVYAHQLSEPDRAIRLLLEALELAPHYVAAALELTVLYLDQEEWAKAEPWLRFVLELSGRELAISERVRLHHLRGVALEHMLRQKEALVEYDAANALDPSDLKVAQDLGRLAFGAGQLRKAERIYGRILDRLQTEGSGEDRVAAYKVLGEIAFQRGDEDRAKECLEKTIAMQPGDPDALRGIVELCAKMRFWKGFVQYAEDLQDLLTDPVQQFDLQLRIGDVYLNELSHVGSAVAAYETAIEYRPKSMAAHSKVVEMLLKAQQYAEALGVLERLLGLERDDRRKARYHGAIGNIYRNHLFDGAKAVEHFNRALDADPSELECFQTITDILTLQCDWKGLARSYKRMLVRVEGDERQRALQYQLCFNLGEIYRSRLKKKDVAKNAFEAALALKPKDVQSLTILAELYEVDSELDKAIQMERAMLEQNPKEVAHYRNLKRLFRDRGDTDAAWVACGVLCMLNMADEQEQEFYREYRSNCIVETIPTLTDEDWVRFLYSKGQDPAIGQVLDLLFHGGLGAQINCKAAKDPGLKKKHAIGLETKEVFMQALSSAARVLGIKPPLPLYESTTVRGLEVQQTYPPLLLVGAPLRTDRSLQESAFVIAKALTYFHRWHVAVWLAGGQATANAVIQGAIKRFHPGWDVGPLAKDAGFASIVSAIFKLSPGVTSSLEWHVARLVRAGEPPDLNRWYSQLELTAAHAGLLLCNDLIVAGDMVEGETFDALFVPPGHRGPGGKVIDLATYAVSEGYLALRQRLPQGRGTV